MTDKPQIERLQVFPFKSLDGTSLNHVEIQPGESLSYDREFALFDRNGEIWNAKRDNRLHKISADYDIEGEKIALDAPSAEPATFDFSDELKAIETWFEEVLDGPVKIRRDGEQGFPDRPELGPSVVSTATIETVTSWFNDLTVEGTRRRLRTNIEVSGVPAFWEDRFVGDDAPAFEVGGLRFEGAIPCGRCVVPSRDPDTGEALPEFRKRFIQKRRESFPSWADEDAFEHKFALTTITSIPDASAGSQLRVGAPVTEQDPI
nr:MOSC N-terminal beta barrel domain-containing protein [Natrialba chahannaoensis]